MGDKDNAGSTKLNALDLLKGFKSAIEKGRIKFLNGEVSPRVITPVDKLIKLFSNANRQKKRAENAKNTTKGRSLADYLPWHEVHEKGQNLWKELLRAAIGCIDPCDLRVMSTQVVG